MRMTFLAVAIVLSFAPTAFADSDSVEKAETVVLSFLELVDELQYQETYEISSSQLRAEVTEAEWIEYLSDYRGPLGSLNSRTADSAEFHESLPDAADGDYIIFTFSSSFENRDSAYEVVAVSSEADSSWKVIGYYIE